jgi:hypothetical protein
MIDLSNVPLGIGFFLALLAIGAIIRGMSR